MQKSLSKNLNEKLFKQQVLDNGNITLDADGQCHFVVTQINDKNFSDISNTFKEQLENENKYNWWIGFITSRQEPPYSVEALPIYGNTERYVTKWFTSTAESAVYQSLRDNCIRLISRANKYIENNMG